MTYNAEGDILVPFVTTNENVSPVTRKYFERKIEVFTTTDGDINSDVLCVVVYNIYR